MSLRPESIDTIPNLYDHYILNENGVKLEDLAFVKSASVDFTHINGGANSITNITDAIQDTLKEKRAQWGHFFIQKTFYLTAASTACLLTTMLVDMGLALAKITSKTFINRLESKVALVALSMSSLLLLLRIKKAEKTAIQTLLKKDFREEALYLSHWNSHYDNHLTMVKKLKERCERLFGDAQDTARFSIAKESLDQLKKIIKNSESNRVIFDALPETAKEAFNIKESDL